MAAILIETITGTNGVIIPPDGYLQGFRAICDRHGILLICDEVMTGFGRTGRWFGVDHWGVVPDMMTLAKGLTSSYLPLGAVAMNERVASHFAKNVFYGGLTYTRTRCAWRRRWPTCVCSRRMTWSGTRSAWV